MKTAMVTYLSLAFVLLIAAPRDVLADSSTDEGAEIARLIKQLGSDKWLEREAATKRLAEIGLPALPALRKAVLDLDLEVSLRALHVYKRLTGLDPKDRQAKRFEAQAAFRLAKYEEMARLYEVLSVAEPPDLLDSLWLAHAHQLAGNWSKTVEAYQSLIQKIAAQLKELQSGPPKNPIWEKAPLTGEQKATLKANLLRQRAGLMWLIGRLQRQELKDLKAAAATFTKGSNQIAASDSSSTLREFRLVLLRNLTACQQQMGQLEEAIKTWAKIYSVCEDFRHWPDSDEGFDISAVIRLVNRLPAGKVPPQTPGLIVLSPGSPKVVLKPSDAKTRRVSYKPPDDLHKSKWWRFVFVPPPGKEFETIKFDCDFEQRKPKVAAHVYCLTRPHGKISPAHVFRGVSWPKGAGAGRRVCTGRFNLPDGAGPVFIHTGGIGKDKILHSITAAATFRPRRRPGPEFKPGTRMMVRLLPRGGSLTCDGKDMTTNPNAIHTRLGPGRHVFRYEVPGRKEKFRCDVNMVPGGKYMLFANLDSPFRPTFTNLRGIGDNVWRMMCQTSMVQMPNGHWLLAYSRRDAKVMLRQSKDLLKWQPPRPLPFNSIFRNQAPVLHVDATGTIWLAWFSNRLHMGSVSRHLGYRLWITRSRDGRKWSRPRPISVGAVDGWPPDPAQIVRGPKGRYWIFWQDMVGSAETLERIRELKRIGSVKTPEKNRELGRRDVIGRRRYNTHVAFDDNARMHMLFDTLASMYYSRSKDGRKWSRPVQLIKKPRGKGVSRGQLIVSDGRACLIYEHTDGAFLRTITLGDSPSLAPAVRFTYALNGMRLCRTKDGRAVLLAGTDTVCLLQARWDDLFRDNSAPTPTERSSEKAKPTTRPSPGSENR